VFDGFRTGSIRWKEYGGVQYREQVYKSGQVRLVPPVGTTVTLNLTVVSRVLLSTRPSLSRDKTMTIAREHALVGNSVEDRAASRGVN